MLVDVDCAPRCVGHVGGVNTLCCAPSLGLLNYTPGHWGSPFIPIASYGYISSSLNTQQNIQAAECEVTVQCLSTRYSLGYGNSCVLPAWLRTKLQNLHFAELCATARSINRRTGAVMREVLYESQCMDHPKVNPLFAGRPTRFAYFNGSFPVEHQDTGAPPQACQNPSCVKRVWGQASCCKAGHGMHALPFQAAASLRALCLQVHGVPNSVGPLPAAWLIEVC